MKVLYDMSSLGVGTSEGLKSGLFRVTEHLAYALADSQECDLTFCSSLSLEIWCNSLIYLQSQPDFKNIPFMGQGIINRNRRKLYNLLIQSINFAHEYNFRRTRKIRDALLSLLNLNFQPLSLSDLKNQDIYHVLYYPIPKVVKKIRNIKRFLTVYDLIPIKYPNFFEPRNIQEVKHSLNSLDKEDWIICISNSTKNDLCDYLKDNIDPNKVLPIHLAASDLFYPCTDTKKISLIRKKYEIPNVPYILSLSTLEPRKNIDHVIRCFVNLVQQESIKDLCLVLAGKKGWKFDKIFQEISNYKQLKGRIIVTGYVENEDLAALYSGAMAFVYPSFYEGFGLPPLEAMQCGIPVITSNTSSLPEVVGDAGIMLDPLDSDGLCQSMLDIYRDLLFRKELSLKSIERAQHFSWSKCAQETIAAYKIALS